MIKWHVAIDGQTKGPYTEAAVKALIETGEVTKGCLVWCKNLKTWEPVESHFELPMAEKKVQSQPGNKTTSPLPLTAAPYQSAQTAVGVSASQSKLLKIIIVFLLSSLVFFAANANRDELSPTLFLFAWQLPLILTLAGGIWMIYVAWKLGKSGQDFYIIHAGLLKALCFFVGAGVLLIGIIFLPNTATIYRVSQARQAFSKYTMDVDVADDTIAINGLIGPEFATDLKRILKVHSGLRTIIITSPGGLVDQGLEAAKAIEDYGNLNVIARKECNSSCLMILMSGKHRAADWNMDLGFHAVSAITQLKGSDLEPMTHLTDAADKYLIAHGVPQDIIAKMNTKGPKSMETVPAIQLKDMGVIDVLMDGNSSIDPTTAKWRTIADSLNKGKDQNVLRWSNFLTVVGDNAPFIAKKHAAIFYAAAADNNEDKLKKEMASVAGEAFTASMAAADGDAVYNYTDNFLKQIDYLIKMEAWKACADYSTGNMSSRVNILSQNYAENSAVLFQKLIESANANQWQAQPIPLWAKNEGRTFLQATIVEGRKAGIPVEQYNKNDRVTCVLTAVLLKLITEQGRDKAPPIMRWYYLDDGSGSVSP